MRTFLLAIVLSVPVAAATAQTLCSATGTPSSCTTAQNLSITTQTTARITVTPTTIVFAGPIAADYNNGFSDGVGHTVDVRINNTWTLSIYSDQPNWLASGGASPNKAASDLGFATNAGGPYTAMPGITAVSAIAIATGTATASVIVNLFYEIQWNWTADIPGTYTLPVILLITAP